LIGRWELGTLWVVATHRVADATFRRRRLACLALAGAALVGGAAGIQPDRPATDPIATTRPDAGPPPAPPTTAAPSPPITAAGPETISLALAGDILTHGPVNAAAARFGAASGTAYEYAPLFAPLAAILSGTDLPLCHLEVPLAPTPEQISGYPVFGAPGELIAGIRSAGYRGCSTASNHALDKGVAGIQATLDTFDRHGLGHAGTARTADEAAIPRIYDVRGAQVAHLSYSYGFNGIPPPPDAPWAANPIDAPRIVADAAQARAAGADLVVVSLHWGTEGQAAPDAQQQTLAPMLTASADIDLLVGHHAHVVQPIQRINGKFVIFGLGNQLSNQRSPAQLDGLTAIATATRDATGRYAVTAVEAVPTWMDKSGWRVLPVTSTLADPSAPAGLRQLLVASYQRTMATLTGAGPVEGLTAAPLPPG
jgi:Bacterial capsule synthesis protein PGA_cap